MTVAEAMRRRDEVHRRMTCPKCGAAPGAGCVSTRRGGPVAMHNGRRVLADATYPGAVEQEIAPYLASLR